MPLSLKGALALAGLFAVGLTVPVQAAPNLVQDGDFETADPGQVNTTTSTTDYFSAGSPFDLNWVITGNVGIDLDNQYVYDGHKSLFLNFGNPTSSISQNLATVAGQQYTLSFAAGTDLAANELDVTFGGTTLTPIVVPNNGFNTPPLNNNATFTLYSFNVTATGPFTGLTFSSPTPFTANPSTLELDDIVVAPIPEASTTISFGLLMALGLGGVALKARKRVKA